MDLGLYLRVAWRFRIVIASGLALAFTLAWASYYRVEFDGVRPSVTPRESTLWQSQATMFVTQEGFPWGRSNLAQIVEGTYVPRFADSTRFTSLAMLYAELVPTDDVRRVIAAEGPVRGTIQARTVSSPDGGVLPLFEILGISTSPEEATALAARAARGFQRYLEREQITNGIPEADRIEVRIARHPQGAAVFSKPSLVRPLFLFLLAAFATIGLAFALENLLPQPRPEPHLAEVEPNGRVVGDGDGDSGAAEPVDGSGTRQGTARRSASNR